MGTVVSVREFLHYEKQEIYLCVFVCSFLPLLAHGLWRWSSEESGYTEYSNRDEDAKSSVFESIPGHSRRWLGAWAVWAEGNPVCCLKMDVSEHGRKSDEKMGNLADERRCGINGRWDTV